VAQARRRTRLTRWCPWKRSKRCTTSFAKRCARQARSPSSGFRRPAWPGAVPKSFAWCKTACKGVLGGCARQQRGGPELRRFHLDKRHGLEVEGGFTARSQEGGGQEEVSRSATACAPSDEGPGSLTTGGHCGHGAFVLEEKRQTRDASYFLPNESHCIPFARPSRRSVFHAGPRP